MSKIKYALIFMLPLIILFASPAALACSNTCSATTQYACSLVTSSMTKSSSGTLTASLTNKQGSSQTETATITGSWFSASTGSVSSTFNQNVPVSVSFTITPNNAGSNAVCVNMESTGCQADCGSLTVDSPASLGISSLSASSSSVAASGSFTVTGTVQNSGTLAAGATSAVTATLSGDTCTVTSGAQSVGQLSGSSSWSNTWTVTMGTSTCILTLSASGTNGGSASSSITVTKSASSSTTAAASSGSAGGSSDALPAAIIGSVENIIKSNMPAGENKISITKSDIAWTQISINLREAILKQVEFTVKSLKEKPAALADPGRLVYQYLYVGTINLPAMNIINANVRFKVPNTWLTANKLESKEIALKRYSDTDKKWADLPTKIISSDSVNTIFEAQTPGFSYFAVGVKNVETVAKEEQAAAEEQAAVEKAREEVRKEIEQELKQKADNAWQLRLIVLGASLFVLIIVGVVAYVRRQKSK